MKFGLKQIFLLFTLISLFSCSRVIPPSKMISIYEDCFIADQWVLDQNYPSINRVDIYKPILAHYGYTPKDFKRSVKYYLSRPDQFTNMINTVKKNIQKKINKVQKELDIEKLRNKYMIMANMFAPSLYDPCKNDQEQYYDAISYMLPYLRLSSILSYPDTLYNGVRIKKIYNDSVRNICTHTYVDLCSNTPKILL